VPLQKLRAKRKKGRAGEGGAVDKKKRGL